uniref:Uncharacterized protein n=1 Tax=Trieres chinensis TaxID=1514140 RepID=A0A7S1ZR92_TRICV|mmetsp:Transcript_30834/g.62948  ORF Transcript_30834/g.62948 Transcript_30834/m.62948 type:complete len:112 (+) Transcript_30834:196-531(+)
MMESSKRSTDSDVTNPRDSISGLNDGWQGNPKCVPVDIHLSECSFRQKSRRTTGRLNNSGSPGKANLPLRRHVGHVGDSDKMMIDLGSIFIPRKREKHFFAVSLDDLFDIE